MALSNPRSFYGVHSFAPYDRDTREFKGILRVLGSSSLSLTGETVPLNGGSSKYPWHVETGLITAELSLTFREYPNFIFELFLGNAPTDTAAESTGNVSAIANASGTSVVDATTGIASVGATGSDEADLKFAKYVVKATSATEVSVYAGSNADFARGTTATYLSDDLAIATGVTIPDTGGTVALADFGLTFTGGSGSVAMTSGDTATFEVRPINTGSTAVAIGADSDSFPEFGAIVLGNKRGNGELIEFDLFRCIAAGAPIGFDENAWSEASVTAQVFKDDNRGGVFAMRFVKG